MRTKILHHTGKHERLFAIALDEDEDPVVLLTSFAQRHELGGSSITAAGGFSSATLGFVDRARGQHKRIVLAEPSEVLSLTGDIAHHEGHPMVHLLVVLGLADGTTRGGRLLEAAVSSRLEIVITERPAYLAKVLDRTVELPVFMAPPLPDDPGTVLRSPIDEVATWLHDLHPARRE